MNATILLISDSAQQRGTLSGLFMERGLDSFELEYSPNLSNATERLSRGGIEAIVLDLTHSVGQEFEPLTILAQAVPGVPIIILGEAHTEDLFIHAVERGAQDYLLLNRLDAYTLARAINGAIGRKAVEDALFVEKERAEVTLNSIGDAVLSTNILGEVTFLNAVAEKMTGWLCKDAIGRPASEVLHVIDRHTRERVPNPLEFAIHGNQTVGLSANSVLIRRDGIEFTVEDSAAPIHDRGGRVTGAVTVFHDVSESRAMTQKMSHLAQHDFLTDLPNRLLLNDRIAHSIGIAQRHGRKLAVLFVDLDHFKNINDSLGHSIGDRLLQAVSQRLVLAVRASDTVSRQGGDEFVLLLPEIEHPEDAASIAESMRASVMLPYSIAGYDLHVSSSTGISVYPEDGHDSETLLKNADTAMYAAKSCGRNNYQFFRQDMNARAVERQAIEGSLRRALERHEFVLNYQPKVNLETGLITGAEALVRWHHPDRGLVFPKSFIPIAEDSGLIVPIGKWILREACRQASAWDRAGLVFDQVGVNISAAEFRSKGFLGLVCEILEETGLDPRHLELELTESSLIRDVESTLSVLQSLSAMGVRLAVDDFGTGYSSLSYLNHFPIDTLKIDQSFVRDVTDNESNATIVSTVIAMGRNLHQRIVAEGVETGRQLEFLRSEHCGEGQGYLFSQPVPASAFTKLLQNGLAREGTASEVLA
ncbi:MAG: EAL domain-containing protein [Burkholderiaceae bacterium]|jgi:diguanylate cyclase (GGDEF)-like protein/PAS domain S-box-containing protein